MGYQRRVHGSQIPSLALSAHNAGVSSNPPCYAGYHHSQHMASCSLHTLQGEKSCSTNPFLQRYQRSRCWCCRCSSRCCYPIFNPCTRGGTRGNNKTNNTTSKAEQGHTQVPSKSLPYIRTELNV